MKITLTFHVLDLRQLNHNWTRSIQPTPIIDFEWAPNELFWGFIDIVDLRDSSSEHKNEEEESENENEDKESDPDESSEFPLAIVGAVNQAQFFNFDW